MHLLVVQMLLMILLLQVLLQLLMRLLVLCYLRRSWWKTLLLLVPTHLLSQLRILWLRDGQVRRQLGQRVARREARGIETR